MANYTHLIGAEEVSSAANRMVTAANLMQHAADNLAGTLLNHQRFMDDWLLRFETLLEKVRPEPAGGGR